MATADSPSEQSPASLEIPQPSSTPVPSSSTVQQPVPPDSVDQPVQRNSAAEAPAAGVPLPTSSQAGDEVVQQSSSDVVVHSSAAATPAPNDSVQTREPVVVLREPVIPTGSKLADLKQKRARERQSRLLEQHGRSPNGNNPAVLSAKTNGAVVNGFDGANPRPFTDDADHVGTYSKYHKRYEIAAPDHQDKCCIVM